jgi:hypothetical protein
MHEAGAFFVTRAKSDMDARRVFQRRGPQPRSHLRPARHVERPLYKQKYPEQIRRIRFKDPESGKTLVFLTNNTAFPALTIA